MMMKPLWKIEILRLVKTLDKLSGVGPVFRLPAEAVRTEKDGEAPVETLFLLMVHRSGEWRLFLLLTSSGFDIYDTPHPFWQWLA